MNDASPSFVALLLSFRTVSSLGVAFGALLLPAVARTETTPCPSAPISARCDTIQTAALGPIRVFPLKSPFAATGERLEAIDSSGDAIVATAGGRAGVRELVSTKVDTRATLSVLDYGRVPAQYDKQVLPVPRLSGFRVELAGRLATAHVSLNVRSTLWRSASVCPRNDPCPRVVAGPGGRTLRLGPLSPGVHPLRLAACHPTAGCGFSERILIRVPTRGPRR